VIEVKIILDSISENGDRLTTFELKYPRFILSEFNTHRVFSRNSASSRAIPVKRMIKDVLSDPVDPVFWGKNKSGMQASEELSGIRLFLSKLLWKTASISAIFFAYGLMLLGLHKQIANRIIEPWMWTKTIVSSTEWDNFFTLRAHPDAQPEFHSLANLMYDAYSRSVPKILKIGEWHLPYIDHMEKVTFVNEDLIKMSVARCARVSYLTHDGKIPDLDKDASLYEKLVGSEPIHASPTEHQATPNKDSSFDKNFKGWHQHRADIEYKFKK
jgi:hypothetical protein